MKLAIEVDGVTHEETAVALNDIQRQQELQTMGINFLRFNALLVINKVEAVVKEISAWIENYEQMKGITERVKAKREKKD